MKERLFTKIIALLATLLPWIPLVEAQEVVKLGRYQFVPEQNVGPLTRGRTVRALPLGEAVRGRHNVLVQFADYPTSKQRLELGRCGITLADYLGGHAYFALVDTSFSLPRLRGTRLTSIIPIRGEWKIDSRIEDWRIPAYAQVGGDAARVQLYHFQNVTTEWAKGELERQGIANAKAIPAFKMLIVDLSKEKLWAVANLPWVSSLTLIPAPQEVGNAQGRVLGKGNVLALPGMLGGRGLTGKGVKVGEWDGNVEPHFDYAARLHQQEFELPVSETEGHGMHVAGSIAGAGLLNPRMRGVAPGVELYTYNFNRQTNGLNEQAEMLYAMDEHGIFLTSHSYGPRIQHLCPFLDQAGYNFLANDYLIDLLVNLFPNVTQVYAAGNDQGGCGRQYGTVLRRAKNAIYVGALDATGGQTNFSSYGPMDDGRVVPTISMKGQDVYSTLPGDSYGKMSGTSMATPLVSGHLALLSERYHQLHHGEQPDEAFLRALIIATADDVNAPGPDYSYGYGILNADAALRALESRNFERGFLAQGESSRELDVAVPDGVKRAWVSIAWSDTVSSGQHPYGEPVLINDLDLTVTSGGAAYLPWVLDKDDPGAEPQRKRDSINNAEIVSIDNPSKSLTIKIAPKRLTSERQGYYVVWHFDTDAPQISYPIGGELFKPGDTLVVQSSNMRPSIRCELSYDGGKRYVPIASFDGDRGYAVIPKDAPHTSEGLMRLIDASGQAVRSPRPFTIMPIPENLRIEGIGENAESVTLAWDEARDIREYEVLYTTDKWAEYRPIAKTAMYKYEVPQKYLTSEGRYAFAVRAIAGDGTRGERSVAVSTAGISQRNGSSVKLPFTEEFRITPSPDVFVELGPLMVSEYEETPPNLHPSPGAHALDVRRQNGLRDDTWESSDPYAAKKAYARIGFQQLDLTQETGKVFLEIYGRFVSEDLAQMRLEVDGQPVKMVTGEEDVVGVDEENVEDQQWVWELTDYKTRPINVALRMVSEEGSVRLIVTYIRLKRESQQPDLSIVSFAGIKRVGNFGGRETVYSHVRNNSSIPLASVPLYATANGRPIGGVVIKDIKPFELRKVAFSLDLSTNRPEGELLDVALELKVDGDSHPEDNVKMGKMYNLGEKYAMKRGYSWSGGYVGSGDELTVERKRVVTDDGGGALGYVGRRDEILLLKPSNPDRAIAVTVRQASLGGENDALYINTPMVNSSRSIGGTRNLAIVRGELQAPFTVVSTAADGGMVLAFKAGSDGKGQGWEIEAAEVLKENTLKIGEVRIAPLTHSEGLAVSAEVENLSAVPQTDISMTIVQGLESSRIETVAKERLLYLNPGEKKVYTFEYHPVVPLHTYDSLRVYIDGYDNNFSDNMHRQIVLNDDYCAAPPYVAGETGIKEVTLFNKTVVSSKPFGRGTINTRDTLCVYRQAVKNTLGVSLKGAKDGLSLGVWIDWNDDKRFEDAGSGEYFSISIKDGDEVAQIPLVVPEGAVAGPKRMRVLLSDRADMSACGTSVLAHADIRDYVVRLYDKDYPSSGDLAIMELTTQAVGAPLSEEAPITVRIVNLSDSKATQVSLAYNVDGGDPVEERAILPLEPFGGTADYTFTSTANLSAHGKHAVTAWIASEDANRANDTVRLTVHSISPAKGGEDFYLHFGGDSEEDEQLVFSDLAREIVGTSFSFDMMLKLDHAQFAPICQAKDFVMLACDAESGFPENSVVFAYAGTKTIYLSPGATLEPGKWQHIAVDQTLSDPVGPRLFVDGRLVDLVSVGQDGRSSMRNFRAMYLFEGAIDNLRFWKDYIDSDIARAIAYTKTLDLPDYLSSNVIADFSMNEGFSNTALLSGEHYALVQSRRTGAGIGSIWQNKRHLIRGIAFDDQVGELKKLSENRFLATFTANTDLKDVRGVAYPSFSRGSVSYNGKEIKEKVSFDFSDGSVMLYGTMIGYYGENFLDTVKIYAEKEPSAACDMLSFAAVVGDNPGLNADVLLQPVPSTVVLPVSEAFNASALTFSFTLSDGAVASVAGKSIQSPITLSVDAPILIKVQAANRRNEAYYSISLSKKNSIIWPLPLTQLFYGDSIVGLPLRSSAGLPIVYTSDNPNVVAFTSDGFRAIGVGNATLIAHQPGEGRYESAEPVRHTVEVLPRQAYIAPRDMEVRHGAYIGNFDFYYTGLLPYDDLQQALHPEYHVVKNGGAWSPSEGVLPVGEYAIEPAQLQPYRVSGYEITPRNGKVIVRASQAVTLSVSVVDELNAPLSGARIEIDSALTLYSGVGSTEVDLLAGVHSYIISLEGYAPAVSKVEITDVPVEVKVVLRRRNLTLTYAVEGEGTIEGYRQQELAKGEDAGPVFALPSEGCVFVGWDDGDKNPTRQDRGVQESRVFKARFEKAVFPLTYAATLGGSISGEAAQSVAYKEAGTEVIATPDADGYFIEWSDGKKTMNRKDENIQRSGEYTAFFGREVSLPYVQHFETLNPLPAFMYAKGQNGASWHVTSEAVRGYTLDGRFLAIENPKDAVGNFSTELYTPRFGVRNVDGDIAVEFDYIFYGVLRTQVVVYYQVEGAAPVRLGELSKDPDRKVTRFSGRIPHAAFTGKPWVQLSLRYYGPSHEWLCVDNLSVTPGSVAGNVQLNYYVTKGGTVNGGLRVNATTEVGVEGPKITAVAEMGWEFAGWSDGFVAPERRDRAGTTVEALFTPSLMGGTLHSLSYKADANGRIAGVSHQSGLKSGDKGLPIMAIATVAGYHFARWSDGSTSNPRVDIVANADVNVSAIFSKLFTLTYAVTPSDGGAILGEISQQVPLGEDGSTVVAEPKAGYHFVAWSDGDVQAERTDRKVGSDVAVTAHFAQQYTLVYSAGRGGKIEGQTEQQLAPGAFGVAVEAKPYNGFAFFSWSDGDKQALRRDKAEKELRVEAVFKPLSYSITYSASDGGEIQGAPTNQVVLHGADSEPVLAQAGMGYHFVKWSDGRTDNPRYERAVIGDVTVQAIFSRECTFTYTHTVGGAIEGEAHQIVAFGEDGRMVKAVAEAGYHFARWSDGVGSDLRTDRKAARDIEVRAIFMDAYTVTYVGSDGGKIMGQAEQHVVEGGDAAPVEAVPDPGYTFVGWSDGSTEASRLDRDVRGDALYTAIYAPKIHEVTVSVENGICDPLGMPVFSFPVATPEQTSYSVQHGHFSQPIGLKLSPGIRFDKWEDGSTEYPRIFRADDDVSIKAKVVIPAVRLDVERNHTLKLEKLVVSNPVTGSHYASSQDVPLGTLVLVNYNSSDIPLMHRVVVQTEGMRLTEYKQSNQPNMKIYQVVDASGPARIMVSVERPSFVVRYSVSEGGVLVGAQEQKVYVGSSSTEVEAIPRSGYFFAGWSDGKKVAKRSDLVVDRDISVNAEFVRIAYTIVYEANGGHGEMRPQAMLYGKEEPLFANAYERPYGTFRGWALAPDAQSVQYVDGEWVKDLSGVHGAEVHLYALWDIPAYPLHFAVEDASKGFGFLSATAEGQEVSSGTMLPKGTEVRLEATPESGYTVATWSGADAVPSDARVVVISLMEETAVKVSFIPIQHAVHFAVVGGENGKLSATVDGHSISDGTLVNEGATVEFKAEPNTGFVVDSWNGVSASTVEIKSAQLVVKSESTVTVSFKRAPAALGVESSLLSQVEAFPNPFEDRLEVVNALNLCRAQLLTVEGHAVLTLQNEGSSVLRLNTQGLPSGVYFLRCEDAQGDVKILRVVKQ